MKKILSMLLLVSLLVSAMVLGGCASDEVEDTGTLTDMKITVLKIGKADAIIINTGTHVVLIDAGDEEKGYEVVEYLNNEGIEKIDTMIITHFDPHSVGGADVVINNIKVENVIEANYSKTSQEMIQFRQAMQDNGITPRQLHFSYSFTYDGAEFKLTPPLKAVYPLDKDDEQSMVVSLTHGENTFLFTGDILTDRMQELVNAEIGEFDFVKVPNHGFYNAGTEEFAAHVLPKYAVITCSDKNPPDDRVVSAYQAIGTAVYETRYGDISIFSDGSEIKIEQ